MAALKHKLKFLDRGYVGLIVGILGPCIGFWMYWLSQFSHRSLSAFLWMFGNVKSVQGPILSISMVFNLLVFFAFIKLLDADRGARGVLFATMLYIPVMLYLKYLR